MMTDVLFSLSFSLNWRKEKSILEFERNSPPTKKRERRTRLLYTNVYENFGKKKANLKRVPFSLFFSLFFSLSLSKAERKNESTTTTRTTLTIYTSMGESDSFSYFFSFFFVFFVKVVGTPNKNSCVFVCVSLSSSSALFFFLSQHNNVKQFTHEPKRESLFCSSFARLLLDFCSSFA